MRHFSRNGFGAPHVSQCLRKDGELGGATPRSSFTFSSPGDETHLDTARPALSPLISHQSLSESEDQGTLLHGGLTSDSYIGVLNTWRAC